MLNLQATRVPVPATLPVTIAENEDYGQTGFVLAAFADMDDALVDFGNGEMIAHDIVEHLNGLGKVGTLHDELIALGAMYAVRVETGALKQEKWAGMYYDQFIAYRDTPSDFPVPADSDAVQSSAIDKALSQALCALKTDYGLVDETDPVQTARYQAFCEAATALSRKGYRRLIRAYAGGEPSPQECALTLFTNIAAAVSSKQSEVCDKNIGKAFTLNVSGLSATMTS